MNAHIFHTAETFYYPVEGVSPAERPLVLHWARLDVPRFRPQGVAAEAKIYAFLEHGRWIAKCPFCSGAQFASREDPRFFCTYCLNEAVGRQWIQVVWPPDKEEIEAEVVKRPHPRHMNWRPGETVADLRRENREKGVK